MVRYGSLLNVSYSQSVRFGVVVISIINSKSSGGVRCCDKSYGAVRCGSPLNVFDKVGGHFP